jgi:fructokinase
MTYLIGLDIGGTKIAGGVFAPDGAKLGEFVVPTPHDYAAFLAACEKVVHELDAKADGVCSVGIGIAGRITREGELGDASPNMRFLQGKAFRRDLEARLGREVRLANDANCMALAEALDGAGAGHDSVLGLTLGTGIGGGFVFKGNIISGANGLAAEVGHLPLPFREGADGPVISCVCKQNGCIEKSINGGALERLYVAMTGKEVEAKVIAEQARAGEGEALRVLDRYFDVFSKAMVAIQYTFDPEIIVCGGSLSTLPGLYEEVPKRWGKYTYNPKPETKFVPAKHGPLSGMRGAAWLGARG